MSTVILRVVETSEPTALLQIKKEPLVKQYKNTQESKYVEII